jgi:Tfp pilus assembly protein PilF
VELDPSYADAYNSLAVAYIELKQYDQAKIALEKALQISPSFQLAKDNLKSVEEMAKE